LTVAVGGIGDIMALMVRVTMSPRRAFAIFH
jgi:hypothetical protein